MSVLNRLIFLTLIICSSGCMGTSSKEAASTLTTEAVNLPTIRNKHLNISVLLDLSNRIDGVKYPQQRERDSALIQDLVQVFKNNVEAFGSFKSNARLRVYFHPEPQNPEIALLAKQLTAECKGGNTPAHAKTNKQIYRDVTINFNNSFQKIYSLSNQSGLYPGSNIWRFMKDDAGVKSLDDTSTFRNILVIVTDGYLFYQNELNHVRNRYSYIERNFPHFTRFRNTNLLNTAFDQADYGLLPTGNNLKGLEVIVYGINPETNFPQDYDIIKKYWEKWLREMQVQHYIFIKSQQPVYTTNMLNTFLMKVAS
jgi:hypothetical protein